MDRSNWDQKGINAVAERSRAFGTESLAARKLNDAISEHVKRNAPALDGLVLFNRNSVAESYKSSDLDILFGGGPLGHVEVEAFSSDYWTNSLWAIERKWPRGLSLLFRKVEKSRHWKFFVKISRTGESFFLVEDKWLFRKWEEGRLDADDKGRLTDASGKEIVTCKHCWCIPWDLAKQATAGRDPGLVIDDYPRAAEVICDYVSGLAFLDPVLRMFA